MNLKNALIRYFKTATGASPSGRGKAVSAAQLNTAISQLWHAQGTYSKADFLTHIVPVFTSLLGELKQYTTTELAEQQLLDLLVTTAAACRYRWTLRLPMKRPGSDYRKYEIIYTDALVTAMAVGCLASHASTQSPQQLAARLLSQERIASFKTDPVVWEDWLGYFERSERGGLYAVSLCAKSAGTSRSAGRVISATQRPVIARPKEPPLGSGRAMLLAICEALAAGSLSFNQPGDPVQVDREGRTYLVYPAILQWCKEQLQLEDDIKRLANRFSRLKVFRRSAGGNVLYRGRLRERDSYSQGYLVENASVLWRGEPPQGHFVIERITAKG